MIESMSGTVSALNRVAARLLRREASLGAHRMPALLQLARWGMDNLEMSGPWAQDREELESLLLLLERRAAKDPAGAVETLAWLDDPDLALQPSQLGPTLEDAAALVLEQMHDQIAMSMGD